MRYSLEDLQELENEGYTFSWTMMRWNSGETGTAQQFYDFVTNAFYAPVNIDHNAKIVSAMGASFADLGC